MAERGVGIDGRCRPLRIGTVLFLCPGPGRSRQTLPYRPSGEKGGRTALQRAPVFYGRRIRGGLSSLTSPPVPPLWYVPFDRPQPAPKGCCVMARVAGAPALPAVETNFPTNFRAFFMPKGVLVLSTWIDWYIPRGGIPERKTVSQMVWHFPPQLGHGCHSCQRSISWPFQNTPLDCGFC